MEKFLRIAPGGFGGADSVGSGHLPFPIGKYRLAVIATVRGKSAGELAIQGMANKQIEILVPSLRHSGRVTTTVVAVWLYRDTSLAIAHLDHNHVPRFIFWDARESRQINCDTVELLNQSLDERNMEKPLNVSNLLDGEVRLRLRA